MFMNFCSYYTTHLHSIKSSSFGIDLESRKSGSQRMGVNWAIPSYRMEMLISHWFCCFENCVIIGDNEIESIYWNVHFFSIRNDILNLYLMDDKIIRITWHDVTSIWLRRPNHFAGVHVHSWTTGNSNLFHVETSTRWEDSCPQLSHIDKRRNHRYGHIGNKRIPTFIIRYCSTIRQCNRASFEFVLFKACRTHHRRSITQIECVYDVCNEMRSLWRCEYWVVGQSIAATIHSFT